MSTAGTRATAGRFANALDRCDFGEATGYLAEDCQYRIAEQTIVGPQAIMASYRESAEWGSRTLEQVIYASEVEERHEGVSVLYIDRIIQHGQAHEYRCRQHLTFNAAGKVARIVHEELPGEREKLNEFFARHGVKR
jgi:hypothetical protein